MTVRKLQHRLESASLPILVATTALTLGAASTGCNYTAWGRGESRPTPDAQAFRYPLRDDVGRVFTLSESSLTAQVRRTWRRAPE